jgi:hypothetical protein
MSQKIINYLKSKASGIVPIKASAPPGVPSAPAAIAAPSSTFTSASAIGMKKLPITFSGGFMSFFYYLSSSLFIIFLVLTFIHFTIYPIFGKVAVNPGATSDIQTAWVKTPPKPSEPTGLNIPTSSTFNEYTVSFEINMKTMYSALQKPNIILYRSATQITPTATDLSEFSTSNLIVHGDINKNDIIVTAMTTGGSETIATLTNVPLGKTFRLTIVYMPSYVEVFMDGKLLATHILIGTPLPNTNNFWSPPSSVSGSIQVGYLQYWPRALSVSEIQTLLPITGDKFYFQT